MLKYTLDSIMFNSTRTSYICFDFDCLVKTYFQNSNIGTEVKINFSSFFREVTFFVFYVFVYIQITFHVELFYFI